MLALLPQNNKVTQSGKKKGVHRLLKYGFTYFFINFSRSPRTFRQPSK